MASVLSTVLSRPNTFLDSEMEQILCFDTAIDAEKFCNGKTALFTVLPEEDTTKYFMVSLMIQQLYREILAVADEQGGKLRNRVVFYLDETGTIRPSSRSSLCSVPHEVEVCSWYPWCKASAGSLSRTTAKRARKLSWTTPSKILLRTFSTNLVIP